MTAAPTFQAESVDVWELEPGDVYLWDSPRETREVLGVIQRTPLHGALLEVRKPGGDVTRTHIHGRVELVARDLRAHLVAGYDVAAGREIIAARANAA